MTSSSAHLGVDSSKGFRPATPNSRGQYSGAVLDELESQNDAQVEGIMGKVRVLKDVSTYGTWKRRWSWMAGEEI